MAHIKLKDVINRVQTKVDKDNTSLIYYVGGEHIESENVCITKRGLIEGSTIGPMFYYGFKAGDFLLVSRNPHLKKAGVVGFDGICSEKTFVLATANSEVLLPEYLPFILQNDTFWEYAYQHRHGSTNTFINWSTLANYEFELPNIEIQRKLAEILWAINDTMESYKRLILATDELVKSQFIEMFGDPLTNPMGWPTEGLSSLGELARGVSKARPRNRPELLGGSYPLVQTGEITNSGVYIKNYENTYSEAGLAQSKLWPKDTLCITIAANIGQTGILAFDACFPDSVVGFISDGSVEQIFMHFYFTFFQKTLESQATQVAQKNINLKLLSDLQVIVPPLPLQKQFSAFVRQSDKSKFELEQALSELTATYKRIISEQLG